MPEHKFTNALIGETSPYLLQHAHNPVRWFPWGEAALGRAQQEDKPVLLSIGYAACHWCHVMERESFENETIAALMNELFICIKVDREERPDLDAIYMQAVQMMTGHGGWPLTVFLTPDQKPFYGGTYYPPEDRRGMPGFGRVLRGVAMAYRERRDDIVRESAAIVRELQREPRILPARTDAPPRPNLDEAASRLAANYDARHGGFGAAPKFPASMALEFLMRCYHRTRSPHILEIVEHTLQQMAAGGIYDQLGGGFHRYSVDAAWLIPHFEKMLYDNALLSRVYLHAYLLTGNTLYRTVVEESLDYILREMTSPEGGFYATQDADSEGEEGKFYTWDMREVEGLLGGQDAEWFCRYYGVTAEGHLDGRNILHVPQPIGVAAGLQNTGEREMASLLQHGKRILLHARDQRIKPARDEKILTAWNGLMIKSLAEAAQSLQRPDYGAAAARCAGFLLAEVESSAGLRHSYKDGLAKIDGFLDDYACLADALLSLYETDFNPRWLDHAARLAAAATERFLDPDGVGFFLTQAEQNLVCRPKDLYDNATPSGNSVAALALLRLAKFTGAESLRNPAVSLLHALSAVMAQHPSAFGNLLCALDFYLSDGLEIAIIGDPGGEETRALLQEVYRHYLPNRILACGDDSAVPMLRGRAGLAGRPCAYVCRDNTCHAPVATPADLGRELDAG
jgi:uncharacterized protein